MDLRNLVVFFYLTLACSFFAFGAETQKNMGSPGFDTPVAANEIKIMAYNVQNLFDAEHDQGKLDFEFLPLNSEFKKQCDTQGTYAKFCRETDWTDQKVQLKLGQIQKAVATQGVLPDLLSLEEVENPNVVGMLAKRLGYKTFVMTNSPDQRGIDVALLYKEDKLTFIDFEERELQIPKTQTRNLLSVRFRFKSPYQNAGVLDVFVNHWPSQAKVAETRVEAAKQLRVFVADTLKKYVGAHVVLMGDFNTTDKDTPNPINDVILDSTASYKFSDVQDVYEKERPQIEMPPGSFFYKGEWNRLDHLIVSSDLMSGGAVALEPTSFRILAADELTYSQNSRGQQVQIPDRYNVNATDASNAGFSDHFAILMKLSMKASKSR